jgi:molecular chaperone DnaJ
MSTMADKEDYYAILGVSQNATEKEIATAYRKQAIKYHPDSNPGDENATQRFKQAAEAYEVLSDPNKRARYDQYGHAGVDDSGAHFTDVEDIFEAFGGLFSGGMFGDFFGGSGRRGRRRHRGRDVRCRVTLDLEEVSRGVKKRVEFDRNEICSKCGGSGAMPGSSRDTCRRCGGHGQVVQSAGILRVQTACPTCRGSGSVVTQPCDACRGAGVETGHVTLDVAIPAGVDDGMQVRLPGEGEASSDGGPRGDCYCHVSVRPHELFQRDGRHLILKCPISYSQAALGAELELPTLRGSTNLTVPAGTESGQVFRVRDQGLADPGGGPRGDLLVQVFIEVPEKISAEHEALLRQLAEFEHVNVTPHRKSFLEKLKDFISSNDVSSEENAS